MAEEVRFDIEEVCAFGRAFASFSEDVRELARKMNSALETVRETWQDSQLEQPAENVLEANSFLLRAVNDLGPIVDDYLRNQEDWYQSYVSR